MSKGLGYLMSTIFSQPGDPLEKVYGMVIREIHMTQDEEALTMGDIVEGQKESLVIDFDGVIVVIKDHGQSCCESRWLHTVVAIEEAK